MMCLASMALFLKKSLLTAIFTAAPQKVSPARGMARISPIWTNRPLSGGATGKLMTRARSAPKKSRRFPCLNFRRGGNASNPSGDRGKRSAPDAIRRRPNRPDKSGIQHECVTPTIPIYAVKAFRRFPAYDKHGTVRCLFPFWMPQTICKACNAFTLMEPSASSLAARSQTAGSSFWGSRKSR